MTKSTKGHSMVSLMPPLATPSKQTAVLHRIGSEAWKPPARPIKNVSISDSSSTTENEQSDEEEMGEGEIPISTAPIWSSRMDKDHADVIIRAARAYIQRQIVASSLGMQSLPDLLHLRRSNEITHMADAAMEIVQRRKGKGWRSHATLEPDAGGVDEPQYYNRKFDVNSIDQHNVH